MSNETSPDPKIRRPVLRFHGGKYKLAPWLISIFPAHRTYVECFGGAASVLMRKPRSPAEIYNDMDAEVVNVFRVLQDPHTATELQRLLSLTPFARDELVRAYEPASGPIEAAAKMIMRSFMGFGSASTTRMHCTGFRASSKRSGDGSPTPAAEWCTWTDAVPVFLERLRGVCIENRDAIAVMTQHDSTTTLHYLDPPYVQASRSSLKHKSIHRGHYYKHDMDDAGHRRLAEFARTVNGMVVLSGYRSSLYDELYGDWPRLERNHMADGARPRIECAWLNPACAASQRQRGLFT
ncbi:MAG TPA: DNA adenine methylase [Terriglobales bacterium]|nr:DNA adenine methylase [Terriglobales bacterium]